MRVFGTPRPFDGGGGGGGIGTVTSVNDVLPDGLGNVDLAAADIPSSGPSSVQADLTLLDGSTATSVKVFESWAEFTALAVEGPVGTWTWATPLRGAGTIVAPAGNKIVGSGGAAIAGTNAGALTFVFDVDGPAISGDLILQNLAVIQNSAGASAVCIDVSAPGPRVPLLQTVQTVGGRIGVRVSAVTTSVKIETVVSIDADIGFQVTGTNTSVTLEGIQASSVVAGFRAVDVSSSATILGGVLVTGPSFNLAAGQWGFSIAHAATFTPPALVQISGASNSGPQDAMIRQTAPGVTDMAIDDDRLVIKGGPSVANWSAQAVAARFDPADPLIVDCSTAGAGVPTVIPYEDGLGNLEIVASIESHFTFFKNPVDPLDWYFEYTGPLTNATIRLTSDVSADRGSAGPSTAILTWERAPFLNPGHGPFAALPNSAVPWVNTNVIEGRHGFSTVAGIGTGDRFRPLISDSSATDVRLADIKLDVAIGS